MIGISQRYLKTFEDSTRLTFVLLILFYNSMPGLSIGDTLILLPEGTTPHYVGSDITYHCSHTNHSVCQFGWLINSSSYESSNLSYFSSITDGTPNYTILTIYDIFAKYNNTEIQCFAFTESGEYLNRSSIIILQGIPPSVRNFSVIVNEDSLDFSWMTPPYLIIDDVFYIFEIVNLTTLNITTTYTLFERNFSIPYTQHQSNKCLNFYVNVSAKNDVGIGENISLFRMDSVPDRVDHYLIKNDKMFDLYVSMSNQVCIISNMVTKNIDLNDVHLESKDFEGFSFDKATSEMYWYKLTLNLKNRYTYGINFIPENNIGAKYVSINSSTHDIRNIKVMETSENEIIIEVNNFNYRNDFVGAFVALLYCGIASCTDIDINNSMYFLTYDVKMNTFNMNHSRGYYQVYAYDIRNDGSVISSEDDDKIAFSIQSDQIYLNSTGHSTRFEPYQKSICSLKQDNSTVSSQCSKKKMYSMNVKQQLILQQLKYNGFITISDPTLLTELICLEISNETYNAGITILLTLKPEERSNVPLGIRLIQDNDNNNELLSCDAPTNPLPTNETVQPSEPLSIGELLQKILIAISVAGGVILIILLIAIFIIAAVIICCCKKKAAKSENYDLNDSRTGRTDSELCVIQRVHITDLDRIYQATYEKLESEWYSYGLKLKISEDELKNIKENNHGDYLRKMLQVWLTKYPATWDILICTCDPDHADLKERLSAIASANSVPT